MKIIGHTSMGYLVEISKSELSRLCGSPAAHDREWAADGPKHGIGTTFEISAVVDQVHRLNSAASQAREGAGYLRALADQLDREVPNWIRAPEPEKSS